MNNKAFRKAFIDTLPVMSGYLVLGIGYGIVMAEKGFGIIWTFLSSFFIYAGMLPSHARSVFPTSRRLFPRNLQSVVAGFSGPDAHHIFNVVDKDLTVTDLARVKRRVCRGDDQLRVYF